MLNLIITILLIALVVYVAFWIVDNVAPPHPIGFMSKAIIGVIGLYALFTNTGLMSGL